MSSRKSNSAQKDSLNVRMRLFWEWKISAIDWQKHADAVIQRVLEWGNAEEWEELVRFYGRTKIINALKKRIAWFSEQVMNDICTYFKLDAKELRCYEVRQSSQGHLNY